MRGFLAVLATASVLAVLAAIPSAAYAKSCSAGYTHAVIGGAQKCLRAGEFCARSEQGQYRHYGYTCSNYVDGEYHLRRS